MACADIEIANPPKQMNRFAYAAVGRLQLGVLMHTVCDANPPYPFIFLQLRYEVKVEDPCSAAEGRRGN